MRKSEIDRRFLARVGYALAGIIKAVKTESHMRFHLLAACVVLLCAWLLDVSKSDWIILIILIALVLAAELINTAIERVVDLVIKDMHPLAKDSKDMAAGAVLVVSIAAGIVGLMIFIKYL